MRRIDKEEVRRNLIELRQLTLEVTDDCNLSCRYCGYGEMYEWYDERQSKYLRFGQIEKLLYAMLQGGDSVAPRMLKSAIASVAVQFANSQQQGSCDSFVVIRLL